MRYMSKCIPKQMHLQPLPEIVGTERRVSEVVRQRVPGHRTGDGERPTADRADLRSLICVLNIIRRHGLEQYDERVAAGRSKLLTTGNIRRGVAAVHEVLGSPALETPANCYSELTEDPLQNIEPVQLGVKQMCQASVELPSITDDTGCGVLQTL